MYSLLLKEAPFTKKEKSTSEDNNNTLFLLQKYPYVMTMLFIGMLFVFANMSVEPILTLYISQLTQYSHQITWWSGITFAAMALGGMLSSPYIGKLADQKVIMSFCS